MPLAGRNQRALLTLLLLRANEAVSAERLVDQLWGEHPPRTATTSLQNTVSQLRKLLGPGLLHTRPTGYLLEVDGDQLDLARFEQLVRRARDAAEPADRALLLREALALWRGLAAGRHGAGDVRASRDPSSRRPSPRCARGPDRRGPRVRGGRAARGGDRGARPCSPAPRASAGALDAGAVPIGSPGRSAGGLPRGAAHARRGARDRARARSYRRCTAPSSVRSARSSASPRRRSRITTTRCFVPSPPAGSCRCSVPESAVSPATSWRCCWRNGSSSATARAAWRMSRRRWQPGTASGPCTTSCTSRSTATSSRRSLHPWLAGLPPLLRQPAAAAAADRLDRASTPASSARSTRPARSSTSSSTSPPAATAASSSTSSRTARRAWSRSRTPTRVWRSTSAAFC